MNCRSGTLRFCFVVALALPVAAVFAVGVLHAQQRGGAKPGGNGGNRGDGGMVMTWTCSNCGKQAGTGASPPAKCPYCGAHFINGPHDTPAAKRSQSKPSASKPPDAETTTLLFVGGIVILVLGVGAFGLIGWFALSGNKSPKPPPRPRDCPPSVPGDDPFRQSLTVK
jgi:hypothetical protein